MNIYFSGIGGVGIGPLAEIALDAGYNISGSDPNESLITEQLKQRGVAICQNQDGEYLIEQHYTNPIDWFVHTSALPDSHPELVKARELGIKTAKRDELLAFIIKEKNLKLLAVAGTHGKTTTTGMLIWTLQQLGVLISYSIGTTISFGSSGRLDPNSEYFVYECDEFDRNFLAFHPYAAIITSIDYDHADTYPNPQDYLDAFKQFASQCQTAITWSDQHAEIFDGLDNIWLIDDGQPVHLKIAGTHNRRNATLVQKLLSQIKINQDTDDILSNFPGTNRRFEKLTDGIYTDYGHHPIEIAATLQMASELSDHIALVYQPHQNVRQHKVRNQYTDQFEKAEVIYWLPTYLSRENSDLSILKPEELIENLTNKDRVHVADLNDDLWNDILRLRNGGGLVLCMGAGNIDSWLRDKVNSLPQGQ